MIDRIKAFLEGRALGESAGADRPPDVDEKQLAATALLVEAALMDEVFGAEERRTITAQLRRRWGVDAAESARLVAAAEEAVRESHQLFAFTRTVNDRFSHDERVELIEMMWEVAFADGAVHAFEDNLIRRISGLIYVSDLERGEARRRVAERQAAGEAGAGGRPSDDGA